MDSMLDDAAYRSALKRAVEAKFHMDALQAELDKAENEYHQAHQALDELEGLPRS